MCSERVVEYPGTLAEVVEHQRWQGDEEPSIADGLCPEVTAVGVERLGTRDREHDTAEHQEGVGTVV